MRKEIRFRTVLIALVIGLLTTLILPSGANAGKPVKSSPSCNWEPRFFMYSIPDSNLGTMVYVFNVRVLANPGSVPAGTNYVANTMVFIGNNSQQSVLSWNNYTKSTNFIADLDWGIGFYGDGLNSENPEINPASGMIIFFDYMGKSGKRIATSGPLTCSQTTW